jgi:hypothetical protein
MPGWARGGPSCTCQVVHWALGASSHKNSLFLTCIKMLYALVVSQILNILFLLLFPSPLLPGSNLFKGREFCLGHYCIPNSWKDARHTVGAQEMLSQWRMWLFNKFCCVELKVGTKNKRYLSLYWILFSSDHLRIPTVRWDIPSIHYHLYPILFDYFLLSLRESGLLLFNTNFISSVLITLCLANSIFHCLMFPVIVLPGRDCLQGRTEKMEPWLMAIQIWVSNCWLLSTYLGAPQVPSRQLE